jgi:hypothetical protein
MREAKGRRKRKFNKSLWTLQENLKYVEFVQENMGLFDSSKENRRTIKINKLISQYVKTRSPDQCRSHHQKMLKYHHTIAGIIHHVAELQGLLEEEAEGQAKMPVRIRKKMLKAEAEEVATPADVSTPVEVEAGEEELWDVLAVRWA